MRFGGRAVVLVALALAAIACGSESKKTVQLVVELDEHAAAPPDGAERELERAVAVLPGRLDGVGLAGVKARREGKRLLVDVPTDLDLEWVKRFIARTPVVELVVDGRTVVRGQIDRADPEWDPATKMPFVSVKLGDTAARALASAPAGKLEIVLDGEVKDSFAEVPRTNPLRLDTYSKRRTEDLVNVLRTGAFSTPLVVR